MINFLQPKWKHPDKSVRIAAVSELDQHKDIESFVEIIRSDDDAEIVMAAINKLHDRDALKSILNFQLSRESRILIENKLDKIYSDHVVKCDNGAGVNDDLSKISSEKMLEEIVNKIESIDVKKQAIRKISDNAILARITESKCGKILGCIAVDQINDEDCLNRVASRASNKQVRSYAIEKIAKINHKEPELSESEKRELKLRELSDLANRLVVSWNWEYAAKTFKESKLEWELLDLDNDHYLKSNFDELYTQFFERYSQFQVEQNEIQKKREAREKVVNDHKAICDGIESLKFTIDGESDEKLVDYKSRWTLPAADNDFKELHDRFENACLRYKHGKGQILEYNENIHHLKATLTKMCDEAEKLIESSDFTLVENQLKHLKNDWTNLCGGHDNIDHLDDRFSLALATFKKKKEDHLNQLNQAREDGVRKLDDLCKSVEQSFTANGSELMICEKRVKEAQKEWDEIDWEEKEIDKEFMALKKRFKICCDRYFEKLRDCREKDGWGKWSNLTLKEDLCGAIETLEAEQDTYKLSKKIKDYHKQWKEIGKVPFEKADYINNRFKTCSDRIYKRCNLFFKHLEEERQKNLQLKSEINREIEVLIDSACTRKEAGKVKALQGKWWKIGAVPKDKKIELEQLFKSNCDAFFAKHKAYLDQLSEEHNANALAKEELCVKAESLQTIEDWRIALDTVKQIQSEWKKIGAIAEKQNKVLWPRFNNAISVFFDAADKNRPKNLEAKKELIDELSTVLKEIETDTDVDERTIQKMTHDVRHIQKKWKSVGPVPKEEEKGIYDSFYNSCNSFFETRRTILKKSENHQKKLLVEKRKMLTEIRGLAHSDDWAAVSNRIDKIMKTWTNVGELSLIDNKDIDAQFNHACNLFFERKKIHSGEIDKKWLANLKTKEELCYRMELLADRGAKTKAENDDSALSISKQLEIAFESNFVSASTSSDTDERSWQNALSEVKKIQNEWKNIGPCPTESEHVLSLRLKKAEDGFFSKRPNGKRIEDPAILKANLKEKISICEKIEKLAKEEDLPSVINSVKKWQNVGLVPSKKDSEILWQRYNNACDLIYAAVRSERENSY